MHMLNGPINAELKIILVHELCEQLHWNEWCAISDFGDLLCFPLQSMPMNYGGLQKRTRFIYYFFFFTYLPTACSAFT